MNIIKMRPRHLEAVFNLQQVCFSDPWGLNPLRLELENPFALLVVGTVYVNNKETVVAFLGLRLIDEVADITMVGTHPDYRGQGLARDILSWIIDFLKRADAKKIALEVRVSNLPAIGLYKSLGFIETYKKTDYYDNPREDGYYMEKHLFKSQDQSEI